jgi:phosphoglucomutase
MKMLSKNEIKDADKAKGDSMSYKESYQKWADFSELPDYIKN